MRTTPATDSARDAFADRTRGAWLGLAVGDALGTTVEFRPPGTFTPMTDLVGGGTFGLKPGAWTDDTSMALCLAESLLERGFDPTDQLARYVRWWKHGEWSSTGSCFDIGNAVSASLRRFLDSSAPWCGDPDPWSAGNGSLMRLSPVAIYYAQQPERAIRRAADSSATTHLARTTLDACRYFAGLLVGAMHGASKSELLAPYYAPVAGLWKTQPLCPEIAAIAAGSFKTKQPPAIKGSGYVVESLEAALWALHTTRDFREGCLAAANLGDDADTTAAIYGQLAGALYGASGIPADWIAKLARLPELEAIGARLHEQAAREIPALVRGSEDADLRVDVLPHDAVGLPGRIGMTWAPGRKGKGVEVDSNRDLETDLARLASVYEIKHMALLLEDHELATWKIPGIVAHAAKHGIEVHRLPIVDAGVPESLPAFTTLLRELLAAARKNQNVLIVCRGGLGRTGVVAASLLTALGHSADDAIRIVRSTRPKTIETADQERFVREHAASFALIDVPAAE